MRSKPSVIFSKGKVWVTNSSTLRFFFMYSSTSLGTLSTLLYPEKKCNLHIQWGKVVRFTVRLHIKLMLEAPLHPVQVWKGGYMLVLMRWDVLITRKPDSVSRQDFCSCETTATLSMLHNTGGRNPLKPMWWINSETYTNSSAYVPSANRIYDLCCSWPNIDSSLKGWLACPFQILKLEITPSFQYKSCQQ